MELTKIKGISDKRAEELAKIGIKDTNDLIRFFPRAYLDLRQKQLLQFAYQNDTILTYGRVISIPINRFAVRRGGAIRVECEQDGLMFPIIWFNQPYVLQKLKVGEEYLFYGRVNLDRNERIGLVNPSFEPCEKNYRLAGIVPQYQLKNTIPQKTIRDGIRIAVGIEKPQSIIPKSILLKYQLHDLFWSYQQVHNPDNFETLKTASDRIAIEEYFKLISAFKIIKGDREQVRINNYSCSSKDLIDFISKFPFSFTDGQKKAVNEIYSDMSSEKVMNRLMQGDVGSGKTAVSLCALYIAVKSGYQAVMIAPTEVLAEQNYKIVKKFFTDYNVDLLKGSDKTTDKSKKKALLESGFTNIIVGTHALLEDNVKFKNLSLCICDEQQRFGVAQRSKLLTKGTTPDVLVMSATPIPRTLSLIFYGDLDITSILDKPKQRIPIQTNIVPKEKYFDMLNFIRKEIENGHQAYLVTPRIEGDDEGTIISVNQLFDSVKNYYKDIEIGVLNGKMKPQEKDQVMQDFKDGKTKILVSTTVIEVGVDVPNATIMVIYNAERFGLSQLHQLRGRVGRSDIKSYCFLLSNSLDDKSLQRLKIIQDNTDGFKISEFDYKMRGGGDFMGSRQSGKFMSDLGFLDYGTEAIFLAKKISDETFESGAYSDELKNIAIEKYNRLKDITLN